MTHKILGVLRTGAIYPKVLKCSNKTGLAESIEELIKAVPYNFTMSSVRKWKRPKNVNSLYLYSAISSPEDSKPFYTTISHSHAHTHAYLLGRR